MTFSNFALMYHKDIDHWVIYHLKYVCEMCRRRLNHFSWIINVVPCGVIVDVNVNFDTWIAWQRQMCGWLFLRQNVRVINLSYYPWLFRSFFTFQCIQVFWKFKLKHGIRHVKFRPWFTPGWWYRCTQFEIPSKHDTASNFCWLLQISVFNRLSSVLSSVKPNW